mmetsp:Transcript_31024/g.50323  ORF Transcript_31024/g.50323 Transcript_31024/m.50323 type:complete len:264 (-) Transcript_31024:7-798(-)
MSTRTKPKARRKIPTKIHGYQGHKSIDVQQRLPKSVVDFIVQSSTTPSLQSNLTATNNSSFIDNFFNLRSRHETFRIGRKQHHWSLPALQHIGMTQNKTTTTTMVRGTAQMDSDVFGVNSLRNYRFAHKQKTFSKWKLKNRRKHKAFIAERMQQEQHTLKLDKVLPLHNLWRQYAHNAMQNVDRAHFNAKIANLDLHGCLIKIIRCRSNSSYANYEGIVVLLSKRRMCIVTSSPLKNKLVCIPFNGTVFTFKVGKSYVKCHKW